MKRPEKKRDVCGLDRGSSSVEFEVLGKKYTTEDERILALWVSPHVFQVYLIALGFLLPGSVLPRL